MLGDPELGAHTAFHSFVVTIFFCQSHHSVPRAILGHGAGTGAEGLLS